MRLILCLSFFCGLLQADCPPLSEEQQKAIPFAFASCKFMNPGRIENMYKVETKTPGEIYSFKALKRGPIINRRTVNWTRHADRAGVGAKEVVLDAELGLLINAWVEEAPFPSDQETFKPIADMIRTFHAYAKAIEDKDIMRFSPGDQALEFLAPSMHMCGADGPFAKHLLELAFLNNQIETALRPVDKLQTIHGDFGYRNIIFQKNGTPLLIDWSDVRKGDVLDDLTYYAYSLSLTPKDALDFLTLYYGRPPTPVEEAQYYMKTIQFFLWHMAKFVQPLRRMHGVRLKEADLQGIPEQKLSDFRRARRHEKYTYKNTPEELKLMTQMALYEIDLLRRDPQFNEHMRVLLEAAKS